MQTVTCGKAAAHRLLLVAALARAVFAGPKPRCFTIDTEHGTFLLDGKPFQIIGGEMHYLRIPREYWRDRLLMARTMGLNTVATYVSGAGTSPSPW